MVYHPQCTDPQFEQAIISQQEFTKEYFSDKVSTDPKTLYYIRCVISSTKATLLAGSLTRDAEYAFETDYEICIAAYRTKSDIDKIKIQHIEGVTIHNTIEDMEKILLSKTMTKSHNLRNRL